MRGMLFAAAVMAAAPLNGQTPLHGGHADMAAPKVPMLLHGYGSGGFTITTSNPKAQAYFNNGMQLAHAFAHKASVEAMAEAVRLASNGYFALAQFADPAEVLALPESKLPLLKAAWHYARGEAFARRKDLSGVQSEAAAIRAPGGVIDKDDGSLAAQTMTYIARNVLLGRAAMMQNRPAKQSSRSGKPQSFKKAMTSVHCPIRLHGTILWGVISQRHSLPRMI